MRIEGGPFKAGDVVLMDFGVIVGRYVTDQDAAALSAGRLPSDWPQDTTWVRRPTRAVHYFPTCCGTRRESCEARSIRATTCRHCLMKRAREICGWRWTHPYNASEVAYLQAMLGDRVAGMADRPQPVSPR